MPSLLLFECCLKVYKSVNNALIYELQHQRQLFCELHSWNFQFINIPENPKYKITKYNLFLVLFFNISIADLINN